MASRDNFINRDREKVHFLKKAHILNFRQGRLKSGSSSYLESWILRSKFLDFSVRSDIYIYIFGTSFAHFVGHVRIQFFPNRMDHGRGLPIDMDGRREMFVISFPFRFASWANYEYSKYEQKFRFLRSRYDDCNKHDLPKAHVALFWIQKEERVRFSQYSMLSRCSEKLVSYQTNIYIADPTSSNRCRIRNNLPNWIQFNNSYLPNRNSNPHYRNNARNHTSPDISDNSLSVHCCMSSITHTNTELIASAVLSRVNYSFPFLFT